MSNDPYYGFMARNGAKTEDKHPDYTGTIVIPEDILAGEHSIAGWKKTSKAGRTYLSLKLSRDVREPRDDEGQTASSPPQEPPPKTSGDDLPF